MTDHYSDLRDREYESDLKVRADKAGRSVEDQRFYENVFLPAKKIHSEEMYRRNMIKIYEDNKDKFDD